ncbi:MAG TPA: amidase [Dehalococcoidia bacterium]|nr:amidase [Dehalococcoidia bacterium]
MEDLTAIPATALAAAIRGKQVSPVEVMRAHLRRIDEVNPRINAVVTLRPEDELLADARAAEAALTRADGLGPLHGVPFTIKDTIETAGLRATAGTKSRADYVPHDDAPAVARLKQAGGILLGKTNTPELAMWWETENLLFGRTNNPWDLERTVGGSSGGEAAIIAARGSPLGVGSDIGGSIRWPAHCTGIAGLKPTGGRVPGTGHVPSAFGPIAWFAALGPMARSVEDLWLALDVMAGPHPSDPWSVPAPLGDYRRVDVRRLKVALYTQDGAFPVRSDVREVVAAAGQALQERGAAVEEQVPPGIQNAGETLFRILLADGGAGLRALVADPEDMHPAVKATLAATGEGVSAAKLMGQTIEADAYKRTLLEFMQQYPIIIGPTARAPAYAHYQQQVDIDGQSIMATHVPTTVPYNLAGLPAASVPCGLSREGLPIGVQVVGQPFREDEVLAVAAALEQALGGYRPPPL